MEETLYVVMVFQKWSSLETSIGIPIASMAMEGSPGFLPVFTSKEAAEKEYPGYDILQIQETFNDYQN